MKKNHILMNKLKSSSIGSPSVVSKDKGGVSNFLYICFCSKYVFKIIVNMLILYGILFTRVCRDSNS